MLMRGTVWVWVLPTDESLDQPERPLLHAKVVVQRDVTEDGFGAWDPVKEFRRQVRTEITGTWSGQGRVLVDFGPIGQPWSHR